MGGESHRERGEGVFTKCLIACTSSAVLDSRVQHWSMFTKVLCAARNMVEVMDSSKGVMGTNLDSLKKAREE